MENKEEYKIPFWAFGTPKRETEVVSPIESVEKALKNVEGKLQNSGNDDTIDIRIYDSKAGEYYYV